MDSTFFPRLRGATVFSRHPNNEELFPFSLCQSVVMLFYHSSSLHLIFYKHSHFSKSQALSLTYAPLQVFSSNCLYVCFRLIHNNLCAFVTILFFGVVPRLLTERTKEQNFKQNSTTARTPQERGLKSLFLLPLKDDDFQKPYATSFKGQLQLRVLLLRCIQSITSNYQLQNSFVSTIYLFHCDSVRKLLLFENLFWNCLQLQFVVRTFNPAPLFIVKNYFQRDTKFIKKRASRKSVRQVCC